MQISSLLLRTSVALLMVGVTLGMVMGIRKDFLLTPAHAHLNLVGFVVMFAAGLYYRLVPHAAESLLAKAQAYLHVVGAIAFPGALALMLTFGPQFGLLVIIGASIAYVAMGLFAVVVFRTASAAHAAPRPNMRMAAAGAALGRPASQVG